MTLVDLSPAMLEVSRGLNPVCSHLVGDMRTVRLGRTFDVVFVHDAVSYLVTEDDLQQAMSTAFEHCRPGGVAVFMPDEVTETFEAGTDHGGHDADDGRGVRYLEWSYEPGASPIHGPPRSTPSSSVIPTVPFAPPTRRIAWACSPKAAHVSDSASPWHFAVTQASEGTGQELQRD